MIRITGGAIEAYRLNEVRPRRPEQCKIEDIYVGLIEASQ